MKSRLTRERHVRFRESLGVKFPGATRPNPNGKIRQSSGLPVIHSRPNEPRRKSGCEESESRHR